MNHRKPVLGIHPNAFVPYEKRTPQQQQQQNTFLSSSTMGFPQSNQWHQGQQQVVIEEVEDTELMDDVVGDNPESAHPISGVSRASSRARSCKEAPYERAAREESPVRRSASRTRVSSRSPSPSPSTTPECYSVTSDFEDDYSRTKSIEESVKDI